MTKSHFLFSLLLFLCSLSFSQSRKQVILDSLRIKYTSDSAHIYRKRAVKPLLAIDSRNSFVHEKNKIKVHVKGFQLGVVLDEHHNLALGLYSVLDFPQKKITDENNVVYNLKLNMSYFTCYYEYIFLDTKRWEMGIPTEWGRGSYQTTATDYLSGKAYKNFADTVKKSISILGVGFDVTYKFFRWAGINFMVGYRVVDGNEPHGINFNGAFYSTGLQIYLGEMVKKQRLNRTHRIYKRELKKIKKLYK